jgi:hypothetical protein
LISFNSIYYNADALKESLAVLRDWMQIKQKEIAMAAKKKAAKKPVKKAAVKKAAPKKKK